MIEKVDAAPARPPRRLSAAFRAAADRAADRSALGRRAKYLLADLDDGDVLVMHLGMSGSFRIEADGRGSRSPATTTTRAATLRAHDHVVFHLSSGARGHLQRSAPLRPDGPRAARRARGLEAFQGDGHRAARQRARAAQRSRRCSPGRSAPLKAMLMDQRLIAGLGNIYVCEALWRARALAEPAGGPPCDEDRQAAAKAERAGRRDPRGAPGRRSPPAARRSAITAARRRARRFPAQFRGL